MIEWWETQQQKRGWSERNGSRNADRGQKESGLELKRGECKGSKNISKELILIQQCSVRISFVPGH